MIQLPDFKKAFDYENNFYLSCDTTRISKILAHYELYRMVIDIPGAIVECGVFKGASLVRFCMFRDLFGNTNSKKVIAFDAFGKFPETRYGKDKKYRKQFINEAGEESISREQITEVLRNKGITKYTEFIEGDVIKTIPAYIKMHPELRISLLNLDTDTYESAVTILDNFYPRITRGGVLILDDYGTWPGETEAVDRYFKDKKNIIRKFGFAMTPCYIIKE